MNWDAMALFYFDLVGEFFPYIAGLAVVVIAVSTLPIAVFALIYESDKKKETTLERRNKNES